jgi:U4/U6.U5 tri-snRNP-associated protein 1
MADAESLSLEETNKLRISLGLAPLKPVSDDTPTVDDAGNVVLTADEEERRAVKNLKAVRAEQAQAAKEESIRRRLQKYVQNFPYAAETNSIPLRRAEDRKALNEKLSGPTLADVEGDHVDSKSWIKRTKQRERELALAEQKRHDFESLDQQFQDVYTESNTAVLSD